jgi:hypothetical protein
VGAVATGQAHTCRNRSAHGRAPLSGLPPALDTKGAVSVCWHCNITLWGESLALPLSRVPGPRCALANLGHAISDRTVGNILRRHNIGPAAERSRTTRWKEFIRSHMEVLAGTDFFTVEVLTWRGLVTYYVLFFIEVGTRRVCLGGITRQTQAGWNKWRATPPCRTLDISMVAVTCFRRPFVDVTSRHYGCGGTRYPFKFLQAATDPLETFR